MADSPWMPCPVKTGTVYYIVHLQCIPYAGIAKW